MTVFVRRHLHTRRASDGDLDGLWIVNHGLPTTAHGLPTATHCSPTAPTLTPTH
uniref:Uncharacterized protein n=1 Tax=Cucumis melo TaxID=3656 RepID=A0A9I9DAR3_CUCME